MGDINDYLRAIFAAHDVSFSPSNGWLTTNGSYPACRSFVHEPRQHGSHFSVRIDVNIAINERQTIIESFADSGTTPDLALEHVARNFSTSALHVLLSAIWNLHDDTQVLKEDWNIDGRHWGVFLGNVVRKAADGAEIPVPSELVPVLERLICSAKFSDDVHWIRVFYANIDSENQIVEVLLDNEPWEEGQPRVRQMSWPASNAFYSARMFAIFRPPSNE